MRRCGPIVTFGSFVPPLHETRAIRCAEGSSSPRPVAPPGFLVIAPESIARRRRLATLPCSVLLHGAAALALFTVPLLFSSELPGPAGAVRAFFVEPLAAPPPPPPPPPPAPAQRDVARAVPTPVANDSEARLTAPVEMPEELLPEDALSLGIEGGAPGGVEGGVPGGVVGGIVGGLPDSPAVAPPPMAPLRVGGHIKEPVKVHDVPPVYPKVAMDAGVQGVVIIEAVIDDRGGVAETRILRGVPVLDDAALEAVRQWTYTPTLLDGVPTPVVMTITVTFRLQRVAAF